MSIRPPTLDEIVHSDKASSYTLSILTMRETDAKRLMGKTTVTAYRRIHEVLSSALDEVERGRDPSEAVLALTKSLILVKYQVAREVVSYQIASYIEPIITNLLSCVKEFRDLIKCRDRARNARLILDALAVLVYQHGRP